MLRRGKMLEQQQQRQQWPFTVADVDFPFKIVLPAYESSFELTLPNRYREAANLLDGKKVKRQFFFTNFHIIPGFYSRQAAELDLDSKEENEMLFSFSYRLLVNLILPTALVDILRYDQQDVIFNFPNLLAKVNEYSETSKFSGTKHAHFFFDWTDTELSEGAEAEA